MSKGAKSRFPECPRALLTDSWALETLALGFSFVCLAIIIVLLSVYDGRPQFSFGGVTLNAVIAILAAGVRIGFMVPIAESLSQWKWIWFAKRARPVVEFDAIDDASRGSKGSALLLLETKSMTITSIAAWITLISIATEPFIQQIVAFKNVVQYRDDAAVTIPYAEKWAGGNELGNDPQSQSSSPNGTPIVEIVSYGTVSDINLEVPGQAAILSGFNSNGDNASQSLIPSCPSGNCTWPRYVSLAVCSHCTDVSDQIKTVAKFDYPMGWFYPAASNYKTMEEYYPPQQLVSYSLPNGLSINNYATDFTTYDPALGIGATTLANLKPSQTLTMKNSTTLLFSASIMRTLPQSFPASGYWPSDPAVEAFECGIYLCAKEYNSRVVSGTVVEESTIISSTRDPKSFQPDIEDADQQLGVNEPLTYAPGIDPTLDALFSNTTYLPRKDLSILIPESAQNSTTQSNQNITRVNITQAAIDALSSYLYNLFDEGTFTNITLLDDYNGTICTTSFPTSHNITCGILTNLTGMAAASSSSSPLQSPDLFSPAIMQQLYQTANLSAMFANVADALSNEFRRDADTINNQPAVVVGQLGTLRTVLHVRWAWLSLPVACVLVSSVFFGYTVAENRRRGLEVWKGSALAGLFHGLMLDKEQEVIRRKVEGTERVSEMEEVGDEVEARLERWDGVVGLRVGGGGGVVRRRRKGENDGEEGKSADDGGGKSKVDMNSSEGIEMGAIPLDSSHAETTDSLLHADNRERRTPSPVSSERKKRMSTW